MVITVTLNPALDKFINLDRIDIGQLNRCREISVRAGGKGINVARILNILKRDTLAMSILGGNTGKMIQELMDDEGIKYNISKTYFNTRENIKLAEKNGRETEINQQGQVDTVSFSEFKSSLEKHLENASILVLAGSVPAGLPDDIYQDLILLAKKFDVKTILDTSGHPLSAGIKSKPFLIKPNLIELSELAGKKLNSVSDIYQAIQGLLDKGIENVVVSVGEQGALYANNEYCYQIIPPAVTIPNTTVGAGDSMVAALAVSIQEGYEFLDMAKFVTALATLYVSGQEISKLNIAEMIDRLEIMEGERLK